MVRVLHVVNFFLHDIGRLSWRTDNTEPAAHFHQVGLQDMQPQEALQVLMERNLVATGNPVLPLFVALFWKAFFPVTHEKNDAVG